MQVYPRQLFERGCFASRRGRVDLHDSGLPRDLPEHVNNLGFRLAKRLQACLGNESSAPLRTSTQTVRP